MIRWACLLQDSPDPEKLARVREYERQRLEWLAQGNEATVFPLGVRQDDEPGSLMGVVWVEHEGVDGDDERGPGG